MTTPQPIRTFYEKLYQQDAPVNPAAEIYNHLRMRAVRDFVSTAQGPALIIGCGTHEDFQIFSSTAGLVAFDLSVHAVRRFARGPVAVLAADALSIPFPRGYFKTVVCSEVLEHIPNIQRAVAEISRVLSPQGLLVVSSPNWHSWFGLARWLGENLLHRSFHSSDQPYDDWKTPARYRMELSPCFEVVGTRGIWYLPPMHFRGRGIPRWLMRIIYWVYAPFEWLLSRALPGLGHLLVLQARPHIGADL
jgi:SAM-dependent methyltransferase